MYAEDRSSLSHDSFLAFFSLFLKFYFIEIQLIYNVVLVSGVQQSDSVIHIHNSLHLLIPNSQSIPPALPLLLGNHKSVVYAHDSFFFLQIRPSVKEECTANSD